MVSSAVSATPGSTLTKRPREEELDTITVELESQEEPSELPMSKRLRIQRVEVRLPPKPQADDKVDLHTRAGEISAVHVSAFSDTLMFAIRWRCSLRTAPKRRVLFQEGARKQPRLLRLVCAL